MCANSKNCGSACTLKADAEAVKAALAGAPPGADEAEKRALASPHVRAECPNAARMLEGLLKKEASHA